MLVSNTFLLFFTISKIDIQKCIIILILIRKYNLQHIYILKQNIKMLDKELM